MNFGGFLQLFFLGVLTVFLLCHPPLDCACLGLLLPANAALLPREYAKKLVGFNGEPLLPRSQIDCLPYAEPNFRTSRRRQAML